MEEKKKKIIILIIIIILVLLVSGIILILSLPPKVDNTLFTLKKDLNIPVYSKQTVKDCIESIEGKVITNKKINTEELGKQEVSFIYENLEGKKRTGTFTVKVVDVEEPLIWLSGSYSVQVGTELDLAKAVLCADNYDSNPTCKIEGEYDLNTAGTYSLTYVATDSSKNEERVDFNLYVYEPAPSTTEEEPAEEPVRTAFHEVVANYKNENTEIGIDVSKWQGEIDFKKVKQAGASFVMIRVGAQQGVGGKYILDDYFKQNIENALKNDLKVGIYFYSYADSLKEAKKQANWVLKQIKDYDITLPIAFDWECYNNFNEMELSLFGLNEVAETFLDRIEEKGYDGMLYGSKNYLNSIWKYHEYDVWLAHYTNETDYDSEYVMWQLCQDGQIDGINTPVDINVLYKNKED